MASRTDLSGRVREKSRESCAMKKYDNFCYALRNLKEIESRRPPYDIITQTGMVSLFEICFEQSWKAMKELLEYSGYSEPRLVPRAPSSRWPIRRA